MYDQAGLIGRSDARQRISTATSLSASSRRVLRCVSSLGCPELSLDEMARLVRTQRLDGLELRAMGGTVELTRELTKQFGRPELFAEHVQALGLRILAMGTSVHVTDGDTAKRDALLQFVPWAEAAGVGRLRMFDGVMDEPGLEAAVQTIAWWRDLRAARGWTVDLMVETHDSLFTTAKIQTFLERVPGAAMLWDAHHTWRRGGEDPVVTWAAIRSSVCHLHVKDSVAKSSASHPYTYVVPGAGAFPMAPLRAVLERDHYAGAICLEWERLWHPTLGPLESALAAARREGWW